jgi:hypothetical protein
MTYSSFYGRTIFEDSSKEIDKLELLHGGDHGEGAFTFLFVIVVVRYKETTHTHHGATAWPD